LTSLDTLTVEANGGVTVLTESTEWVDAESCLEKWAAEDPDLEKWAAKRKRDLAETKQQEMQMWQQWKMQGEKPNDLRPLLKSFKPLIRSRANHWANRAELPPESVHAEFNRQFVNALRTYDPTKGAQLGSWVTTSLQKAQRWVSQHQDPTRVQEHRYYKMGEWDNALATLDDQLGREPTTREMSEYLGWSEAEAGRMESEKRKSLYSSGFGGFDPTVIMPSREAEKLKLVRYELSPEELQVYDYTVGTYGKPQLRPGEIAKELKISPSKVTRIRNAIVAKLSQYE
jgi:DNA-directed RNA polymerase specialized sigma subunit